MTPFQIVGRLRQKGYRLGLTDDGALAVSGKRPENPDAALRLLTERQRELATVLAAAKATPVVDALAALGARIVDIRLPGEPRPEPAEWCPGPALPGQPRSWRYPSEFLAYLRRIGARVFIDGSDLVLVGPRELLSQNVCAGFRCFRAAVTKAAARSAPSPVGAGEEEFRI